MVPSGTAPGISIPGSKKLFYYLSYFPAIVFDKLSVPSYKKPDKNLVMLIMP
jgi:hypothetical protein